MTKTQQKQLLPNCLYTKTPLLIPPKTPTPNHTLYLSNLDDQDFIRFSINYIYVFERCVSIDDLKISLSRALVEYYPLSGRLRPSLEHEHKLVVECNGEGAVFAEGVMDISVEEFMGICSCPNDSWRKLLYTVEADSFLDVPPLVVQVTKLSCGGMILCTTINHCLCDGTGTSQFLKAWAHLTTNPTANIPVIPFHFRHALKPRSPIQITPIHPHYYKTSPGPKLQLESHERLVSSSLTFTYEQILHLKRQRVTSPKCTTFEALVFHTWQSWAKALNFDPTTHVKLLFSMNFRKKINPRLPYGYYGNGFVLGCAEANVKDLVDTNLRDGVRLVQQAKSCLTDEYVRTVVDLLEDKTLQVELSKTLVISQWSNLGLEDLDFGEGKPLHMGPLTSDMYCLFCPVVGENDATRVHNSMPESSIDRYEHYMRDILVPKENEYVHKEMG